MTARKAQQAPTLTGVGALPAASPSITALAAQNTELATAIRIARTALARYSDSRRTGFTYPRAFGATYEALRILLHAVDTEAGEPQ